MSFESCLRHMLESFRTAEELDFIPDKAIQVGARKHEDPVRSYELWLIPTMEHNSDATQAEVRNRGTDRQVEVSRESRFYRIHITAFLHHPDIMHRMFGTPDGQPGQFELASRIRAVWEREYKRFSPRAMWCTFEATEYVETFPPPCVKMVSLTAEECESNQVGDDVAPRTLPALPFPWARQVSGTP